MDTPLVLILILAFAFAATHLESLILGERVRLLRGAEYLLIGVLAGPYVLNVLSDESIKDLTPLLSVITGFIGFLAGLPLALKERSSGPPGAYFSGLVLALAVVGSIAFGAYTLFAALVGDGTLSLVPELELALAAGTLGLGAAACSTDSVRDLVSSMRAEGPLSSLIPRISATMAVVGIVGFGFVTAGAHGTEAHQVGPQFSVVGWLALGPVIGMGLGMMFHVFVGEETNPEKLFVAVIGVVALASGIAHALELSPLFVGLVLGVSVANLCRTASRLRDAVDRLKRPLHTTLLILMGAVWGTLWGTSELPAIAWAFPAGFVIVRWLGLRLGGWLVTRRHPTLDPSMSYLGSALMSQSALAAAIAAEVYVLELPMKGVLVTCLLVSAVVNEFWAARMTRRVLQVGGETGRRARQALADAPTPAEPENPAEVT